MSRYWVLIVLAYPVLLFSASLPRLSSAELPTYPERARTARVAGKVRISFLLSGTGEVQNAAVISGNPLLRDAALANVKTWKFHLAGGPTSSKYQTEFIYSLGVQNRPGEPRLTVSMQDFRRLEVSSELYVEPTP